MHHQGSACWVDDLDGNLRFEVLLGGNSSYPENLHQIMQWNGDKGWTVVSAVTGGGTYSRWKEEWQKLIPAWDTWLRVIVGQSTNALLLPSSVRDVSPGGRPLALPVFSQGDHPRSRHFQMPDLAPQDNEIPNKKTTFRNRMSRRGLGQGGADGILSMVPIKGGAESIRITFSHLPVTIHLGKPRIIAARFNPEEVFLPWWPLSEVIQLN